MVSFKQNADGTAGFVNDSTGLVVNVMGGATPTTSAVNFYGESVLRLALTGVVATTGGAIAGWANNLGYDIIVTNAMADVTTASTGAANLTVGQNATNITTSGNNLLAAVAVGTTGVKVGSTSPQPAVAVKVKAGEFVTAQGSADSSGLVGTLYLEFVRA